MTGECATPENTVLFVQLTNYHPLAVQQFHYISDSICILVVLDANLLEDYRTDPGGDTAMGFSSSNVIIIPSTPLLLLDEGRVHIQMILCMLCHQKQRQSNCINFCKSSLKIKILEFFDKLPPGVNQDCSSSESESDEDQPNSEANECHHLKTQSQ